jgi:hypothetical protein
MFSLLESLLVLSGQDLLAVTRLADAASGGHLEEYFKSSDTRFAAAVSEDTREFVLDAAKKVSYNGTALSVVFEILRSLHAEVEKVTKLSQKWERATQSDTPPDTRDLVVGATTIAPAFESSTGPIRKMLIEALRGSFTPEIFVPGYSQELLESMIFAKLVPSDIGALSELPPDGRKIDIYTMKEGQTDFDLEPYERLAKGGFVELRQAGVSSGANYFITDRTQATAPNLLIRRTIRARES